jgi:tetratricopeptide (TPR) repeat protein
VYAAESKLVEIDSLIQAALSSPTLSKSEKAAEVGRLTYWRSKYSVDKEDNEKRLGLALEQLDAVKANESTEPLAVIAWVAVKGELASYRSKIVALSYLKPLERAAIRLKELAPQIHGGAPDRILGRLYHLAPSFISIGSRDKARKHLNLAYDAFPNQPENAIFLADFLFARGEFVKAREILQKLLTHPQLASYPLEWPVWEQEAQKLLKQWEKET